ncbi:unnamed protein product [Thelazia callipaeda]|uniref:Lipoprotein n=1 Tax=Thelazia callipaeda TaxID=103827 RepID=A0A0N5D9M5_THECL|nr:unnamed protein product [Thelazia callipaeda]
MNVTEKLFLLIFICLLCFTPSKSCKIELKIFSKTDQPFMLQVIEGENCSEKPWHIKTWKKVDDQWVPAAEIKARLEGFGYIRVVVENNYMPSFRDRFGILCFNGNC